MNTLGFRSDPDYWERKLANYLHDPPDKALSIRGHEQRAQDLRAALHLPDPDVGLCKRADVIAAGMDRTYLPGYHPEEEQSGAMDFLARPVLTHPTGAEPPLRVANLACQPSEVFQAIKAIIAGDFNELAGKTPFRGNRAALAPVLFHYVHHALRERLAQENVGGLGSLWHRLPADTRLPDHSIWQHSALVSALTSCFTLSSENRASLLVFAITPVQDFISRARKLRDFWTGSLILSWLTFEGLRQVIFALGGDHVLYPSLLGQPLVSRFLVKECHLPWLPLVEEPRLASLPNKFVCLVPTGQEAAIAEGIKQAISTAWEELGRQTLALVERTVGHPGEEDEFRKSYLKEKFDRQVSNFWEFHWAACPLLEESAQEEMKKLLYPETWKKPVEFLERAKEKKLPFADLDKGQGAFYGVSHALAQGFLAAGKTWRMNQRPEEGGIKCHLQGDLEILRYTWRNGEDQNPPPGRDPFWSAFKQAWPVKSDFKSSERLSAVALVKRLAYRTCKELPQHPLKPYFRQAEAFPSTTEVALTDWLDRVAARQPDVQDKLGDRWRQVIAQVVHDREPDAPSPEREQEITKITPAQREQVLKIIKQMAEAEDPVRDEDKYYAILLMDGDHLGRLVSGETLASRWETVMHPDLTHRLGSPEFQQDFADFWRERLKDKRFLAPAVHAAISEGLGDFSLYTVAGIIKEHRGELIYAGGDDVCAVLPVSEVLAAARRIAASYSWGFVFLSDDQPTLGRLSTSWTLTRGRLALHLGQGKDLSISAGILLAHHKRPLTGAMRRAHELLKIAKKRGGRNAVALELGKRGGGARLFVARWQESPWEKLALSEEAANQSLLDHFDGLGDDLALPQAKTLSTSLLYRLEELAPGLQAIMNQAPHELVPFLLSLVKRPRRLTEEQQRAMSQRLAALIGRWRPGQKEPAPDTEALPIARFLGVCRRRRYQVPGGES